jgi:DNA-binding FadR family transcriptional regulator
MDGLTGIDQFCHQFLGLRRAIEPEACALASKFASVELSEISKRWSIFLDNNRWIKSVG